MSQPIKGQAYVFFVSLTDINDPVFFINNPTIAAGDFKVSVDGGAFSNLATLPVVTPPSSNSVKISLSAIEMGGDKILVNGKDAFGDQWGDIFSFLDLENGTVETVLNILEGDHTETSIRALVKKKGTEEILLDKKVAGSGLQPNITVTTREQP